jgi:hypothetical protein
MCVNKSFLDTNPIFRVIVIDSRKDTSLLPNTPIFRKLRICDVVMQTPGMSYWKGRLGTVDLRVDQLLFIMKISFTFFTKQTALMRRSTVLSLPPQLVFPADTHHNATKRRLYAIFRYAECRSCSSYAEFSYAARCYPRVLGHFAIQHISQLLKHTWRNFIFQAKTGSYNFFILFIFFSSKTVSQRFTLFFTITKWSSL